MRVRFAHAQPSARPAFALVLIIALLAIIAVIAGALVPSLIKKQLLITAENESRRLQTISDGLRQYVQRAHLIPDETNWVTAVAQEVGMSPIDVAQTWSAFATDPNLTRVYLIHPSLTPGTGSGLLPYQQDRLGLEVGDPNEPSINSRVMIVSNTRREATLPVASGVISASEFDAIWDWSYDPATKSAPSGWPSTWNGTSDGLHVERVNLANRFHVLTLENLQYTVDGSPTETVTTEVQRHFLRGSLLNIYTPGSVLYASRVINKNAAFSFATAAGPLLYYKLDETSGSIATNFGTLGPSGNGTYTGGAVIGVTGPRPPAFPTLPAGNNAADFDGSDDYVETAVSLPETFGAFTIAGWVYPTANMEVNESFFGQGQVLDVSGKKSDEIVFSTKKDGNLIADWPYPNDEWHHITAIGDGTELRLYLDGVLVGTKVNASSNYGNSGSSDPFRIGGKIAHDSRYVGSRIDEVVFYTRALTQTEITALFNGTVQ